MCIVAQLSVHYSKVFMSSEVIETSSTSGESVSSPAPETTTPVESKKTFKLKVNNDVREVDEDRIVNLAQLGFSSTERYQKAAALQKQAEQVLSGVKSKDSFFKSMETAGLSRAEAVTLLEDVLRAEYEEQDLSPDEKAKRKEKQELEKYRKEAEEREAKSKEETEAREVAKYREQLEGEVVDALGKSELPRTEMYAKAVLHYIIANHANGVDMTAHEATKLVELDFQKQLKESLEAMSPAKLRSFLGEKAFKALMNDRINEVKSKEAPFKQSAPEVKPSQPEAVKPKKPVVMSDSQFRKALGGF
jgi:hypothetical protein